MAIKANGFPDFIPSILPGPFYAQDYDTDGSLWLPAVGGVGGYQFFTTTYTPTRTAAGDYFQATTTPAAQTGQIVIDLSQLMDKVGTDPIFLQNQFLAGGSTKFPTPKTVAGVASTTKVTRDFEGHIIRGIQMVSADVIYNVSAAAFTSITCTFYETSYTVSFPGGTVTSKGGGTIFPTTSANIQIGPVTPTAPYVIGNNASLSGAVVGGANAVNIADYLEIVTVNPGTAVLHLYGVRLYFNYCLM